MNFRNTEINGVIEFFRTAFEDERGVFQRLFECESFTPFLNDENIVHINHSLSCNVGDVRGLHLQIAPFQEIKIIQAVKGKVLDYAVDLRKDSPTFLKHVSIELSAGFKNGLILPKGIAHGFQVLEKESELIYFHTEKYYKDFERGFNIRDPLLGIRLPHEIKFMTEKDKSYPFITDLFEGF
jgi:dTDP-4-dehydrorhamnose 3,5-epimerase